MPARNCHKCRCPLVLVAGEKRRHCIRCGGGLSRSEYNKRYREKNRDRLLAADRHRYQAGREDKLAKARAYYLKNREEILKKKREREHG